MAHYSINIDDQRRLVLVDVSGKIVKTEGEKIISEARTLAGERSYDVIYDMRGSYSAVQISDWFRMPRNLAVFKSSKARLVKAAIVVSKDDRSLEQYRFFETVSKNLGFAFSIFFSFDEAVEWLSGSTRREILDGSSDTVNR